MNQIFRLFISLILLLPIGLNAQHVEYPTGSFKQAGAEQFEAKNLSSKYYNELWTYQMQFDNGMQVVYTFSINDFGSFKGRVTGANLSVSWKDGNTYVVNKEYNPNTLIVEPDSNYIRLHPERPFWAKGSFDDTHRLFFHNTKDGIQYDVDLTFYDIAAGKVLGDGVYKSGGNEIGLSLLIPHANVKGFVAINGDTVKVNGTGYMDHIYQNSLSTDIIDRSYRVKAGDTQDGYYFHFLTLKKADPIGYGVGYRKGIEFLMTPAYIRRMEKDKHVSELDSYVAIKPYQTEVLNIRVKKHLNTYSIINELGGIAKFLAKRVVGELVELNGTIEINHSMPGYYYYLVTK